jgi:hypothetical protein
MYVTRWGRKEAPLSQLPGWGVEIMMGLYGEQSVRAAIEAEKGLSSQPAAADEELDLAAEPQPQSRRDEGVGERRRWLQRRRG